MVENKPQFDQATMANYVTISTGQLRSRVESLVNSKFHSLGQLMAPVGETEKRRGHGRERSTRAPLPRFRCYFIRFDTFTDIAIYETVNI